MPLKDIQLATISPSSRTLGRFIVSLHSDDGHKHVDILCLSETSAVKLRNSLRENADRLLNVGDYSRGHVEPELNVVQRLEAMFGVGVMKKLAPIGAEYLPDLAEPVKPGVLMTSTEGRLFMLCGGEVLVGFNFASENRSSTWYLVRDDSAASAWDTKNAANGWNAGKTIHEHGPRPSQFLRLALSV